MAAPEKESGCYSHPSIHPLPHSLVLPGGGGGAQMQGAMDTEQLVASATFRPCSFPASLLVGWKDRKNSGSSDKFAHGLLLIASLFCDRKLKMHTCMSVLRGLEAYHAQTVAPSSPLVNICWMITSATTRPRYVGTRGHLFGWRRRRHGAPRGY